jgi:hypothetical protein
MRGLLADVNVQGHLPYILHLLEALDLLALLAELNLEFATFPELNLQRRIDDRTLWNFCQESGWVLFTADRRMVGADSLEATLRDSWRMGLLPVITLSNTRRFENNGEYASRVAHDVAQILFDVTFEPGNRDRPRIYVPL